MTPTSLQVRGCFQNCSVSLLDPRTTRSQLFFPGCPEQQRGAFRAQRRGSVPHVSPVRNIAQKLRKNHRARVLENICLLEGLGFTGSFTKQCIYRQGGGYLSSIGVCAPWARRRLCRKKKSKGHIHKSSCYIYFLYKSKNGLRVVSGTANPCSRCRS